MGCSRPAFFCFRSGSRACARANRGAGGLRLAAGYVLFVGAIAVAHGTDLPNLGARVPVWSAQFLGLVALTALSAASLAIGASAGPRSGRGAWTGAAIALTSAGIVAALLLVSPSRVYPYLVAVLSVGAYEAWRRAIAAAPESGPLGPFRLAAGMTLLLILLAVPLHAHRRLAEAYRVAAAIRLPDAERISAGAVVAVRRAVERTERFDLAAELPAPIAEVDISDLAYRLWREGESEAPSETLIAFEVFDRGGGLRSRFSLIPEADAASADDQPGVRIERHRVALVQQTATLSSAGEPWGRAVVSVADWPNWDPLPPRLEVYRRLVGAPPPSGSSARPVLVFYGPDGSRREEGPDISAGTFDRVRRTGRAVRVWLRYRGEELYGEVRPRSDGFQLIAIPGPGFLPRLLTAALLLPGRGRALPARRRDRPRSARSWRAAVSAISGRREPGRSAAASWRSSSCR